MLVTFSKASEVYFPLLGTNGFHVKTKKKNDLTAAGFALSSESQIGKLADYVKNCTRKRSARAPNIFSLIQPIKSVICDAVVAIDVVISYIIAGRGRLVS